MAHATSILMSIDYRLLMQQRRYMSRQKIDSYRSDIIAFGDEVAGATLHVGYSGSNVVKKVTRGLAKSSFTWIVNLSIVGSKVKQGCDSLNQTYVHTWTCREGEANWGTYGIRFYARQDSFIVTL